MGKPFKDDQVGNLLVDELLQRYLDGSVTDSERQKVEKLLETSSGAKRLLEQYKALSGLLQEACELKGAMDELDERIGKIKQAVMKSMKENPPIGERVRVALSEFFLFRKRIWVPIAAVATASIIAVFSFIIASLFHHSGEAIGEKMWSRVTSISVGVTSSMIFEMEDEMGNKTSMFWVIGEESESADEGEGDRGERNNTAEDRRGEVVVK